MLLLMVQPNLDNRRKLGQVGRRLDQSRDRVIDMATISGHFIGAWTREHAALRTGVARTGRNVIGIEQVSEAFVEGAIALAIWPQQKLFEKPGDVSTMPLGWARIRH